MWTKKLTGFAVLFVLLMVGYIIVVGNLPWLSPATTGDKAAYDALPSAWTGEDFDRLVLKAEKPVLVDFYATWCGPCQRLAPTIGALSKEYKGKVDFIRVDGDAAPGLVLQHKVGAYPTVILFRDGKARQSLVGLYDDDDYRKALKKVQEAKTQPATKPRPTVGK